MLNCYVRSINAIAAAVSCLQLDEEELNLRAPGGIQSEAKSSHLEAESTNQYPVCGKCLLAIEKAYIFYDGH